MIAVLSRRRPELWTIAAAVVAWLMIVSAMPSTIGADQHHASAMAEPYARQFAIDWLRWSLMVLAMMLPLTIDAVRATAIRSLWRRRDRAVAVWLCGYLAPWLLLGAVALPLMHALGLTTRVPLAIAGAFMAAALWQRASMRARLMRRTHRAASLAPTGWRADRDCFTFGWSVGGTCVATCGATMIATWLAGHGAAGVISMCAVTALAFAEKYSARGSEWWLSGALVAQGALLSVL